MAYATLIAPAPGASAPVLPTLSPPMLTGLPAILALDLGSTTGWALRGSNDRITSGTMTFKPSRFEGGGMRYLRFNGWLQEIARLGGPFHRKRCSATLGVSGFRMGGRTANSTA